MVVLVSGYRLLVSLFLFGWPDVEAALFLVRPLPPPPPGAEILARLDGAGARCAADGRIALIVEDVVRNLVLFDVIHRLLPAPVGQGVDLDDAAVVDVDVRLLDRRTGHDLIPAQTGDPGIESGQRAAERFHFADAAAELAR